MKHFGFGVAIMAAALCASIGAQPFDGLTAATSAVEAQPPAGQSPAQSAEQATPPVHVYIRAGLKSHGPGQHDYPQYLADWSKILTDRGAIVDGSLHFPSAGEIANTDVMVMYKGDAAAMAPDEKTTLEAFIRRGGGLVS